MLVQSKCADTIGNNINSCMKKYSTYVQQEICEGVDDPGIFKAYFLAGGPGSGKSFVAKNTTLGFGLKMINSDAALEIFLKKANISLDFTSLDAEQTAKKDEVRARAKALTNKKLDLFIQGRLGLVIDGTGRDVNTIKKMKDRLDALGYDTYMIFVNTSLETALERNDKRERTVNPKLVKKFWHDVQSNMGEFQKMFTRKNFFIIDNNKVNEDMMSKVRKEIMKNIKKPPQNRVAKRWITLQRKSKKR